MTHNPRMLAYYGDHMTLTLVCIRGFARSPCAYGDIPVTNHMHTGNISIWEIKSCIPICVILHTGITVIHMGIPICKRTEIAKQFAYGDPRTHNELCAYGD